MTTADDGRSPYESGGVGEKFRKRPFRPEINEEPQNVSLEAGQNNSTGVSEVSTQEGGNFASISITIGKSELGQMLKQMTFTRSETQHLIALLHSRTIEESATPLSRLEASTSGSIKRHKHGGKQENFYASVVGSRVLEEDIASSAELANAYKGSTISTQDSKLISNKETCLPKTPMASTQHPATMENLPDEVLVNILIRLLAKQLAQMRSVSKSWNALLSHSSFIKSHLDHSLHYNDQILLVFNDQKESKIFTAHPCESPHLELTNFIKLPVNPQSEYTSITIIGCINGLICFSYGDFVIQIWNPSLSAVLTLPPYSMPSHGCDSIKCYFRFGFDPKADDYKVVKLTHLAQYPYAIKGWLQVEIYSMRKGSWELITERFPSCIIYISDYDGVCADGHDGHLHWLGYSYTNMKFGLKTIVAFDLFSETFRKIPLPDCMLDDNRVAVILGVLAGKLFVVPLFENAPHEVWVMEEYGVAESWVKHHVFSQFTEKTYLYGFTSYNEFLFEDNSRLVLYDSIANKEKVFGNYYPRYYRPKKIVKYVDSLIWIAPVRHEMIDDAGQN